MKNKIDILTIKDIEIGKPKIPTIEDITKDCYLLFEFEDHLEEYFNDREKDTGFQHVDNYVNKREVCDILCITELDFDKYYDQHEPIFMKVKELYPDLINLYCMEL